MPSREYESLDSATTGRRVHEESSTSILVLLTVLASIGGLLFGYDTGIISGALVMLDKDFYLNDVDRELIVSLTVIGALGSAAFGGYFGDHYGRKPVVIVSSITFTVGAVMMASAQSLGSLLLGRFVVGLGVGSASMIVPVYLAECAPSEHRGAMVTCMNVALTFGQLISCVIAGVFSTTKEGWRYMLGIAAIPAVVQLLGVGLFLPESPRYLVQRGHIETGREALAKLRGTTYVNDEIRDIMTAVLDEQEAIIREMDGDRSDLAAAGKEEGGGETEDLTSTSNPMSVPLSWDNGDSRGGRDSDSGGDMSISTLEARLIRGRTAASRADPFQLLKKTKNYRALLLGCMIQSANQLGGINTVMYYGASIFTLAGASHVVAIWLSIGLAGCNFIGSLLGFRLTDKLGRRPLTMGSMFMVSISLMLIGCAFYFTQSARARLASEPHNDENNIPPALWVIFATVCMYLLCFASGMGCTPWTICSEIYPMSIRGLATSITTSSNWTCNLLMSMTFLTLTTALTKHGAFFLYAVVSFGFVVFFYIYLPETRGVPLEDTPQLFSDAMWGRQEGLYGRVLESEDNRHMCESTSHEQLQSEPYAEKYE